MSDLITASACTVMIHLTKFKCTSFTQIASHINLITVDSFKSSMENRCSGRPWGMLSALKTRGGWGASYFVSVWKIRQK
jgi:hypothetical protein